jgi:NifU-like protein involved in Fe-S cluster formation
MASAARLYSPQILALATGLAGVPLTDDLPLRGEARSRSCGSTLAIGLDLDAAGRVTRVGIAASACAIGQASAMIFAAAAPGRSAGEIDSAGQSLAQWLAGQTPMPDWPGLAAIAPAADFAGRHGAIQLAWQAARSALSSPGPQG